VPFPSKNDKVEQVQVKLAASVAASVVVGCAGSPTSGDRTVTIETKASTRASSQLVRPQITTQGECITAELFEEGVAKGEICVADAQARGLTIVDLTDTWTPTLFQPARDGQVPRFRERYLALAQERIEKTETGIEALAELYGIVPAFAIVKARLGDDARHSCHAAIDAPKILLLDRTYSQDNANQVKASIYGHAWLGTQLEKERVKRKLDDVAALEADPTWHERYIRWKRLDELHEALLTAQAKLHCEGWLADKDVSGEFGWRMGDAVEHFQRRNFLMPTERLDEETRQAMQIDSRELDFRLALRVLRERVVESAGILEDGTAGSGPSPVLGRMLDPPAMRAARGHKPLPNAAPDLVGAATEAAAKALGWTGPAEVRAFFDKLPAGARVAIALPALPAYYQPHMALSVEIDRGDVYYEDRPPSFKRMLPHRPTLVVYVDDAGTKRPLVRWPTTIGGWAEQRLPGGRIVQRWKESEVGPRIWQTLTAAPAWMPPRTTPDKDLVKNLYNGHWALKSDLLGPGPRSAYGMVLLEHLQVVKQKDGTERLDNNGIGTHGSASVTSIVNGTSHGCHRLYNQLAVRLGDFLLHHRDHVVKGEATVGYRRLVWHNNESFKAEIDSRGFQYELTPPIDVNVTKGTILSKRKIPPRASAPALP
jgi:hypothetical protein